MKLQDLRAESEEQNSEIWTGCAPHKRRQSRWGGSFGHVVPDVHVVVGAQGEAKWQGFSSPGGDGK